MTSFIYINTVLPEEGNPEPGSTEHFLLLTSRKVEIKSKLAHQYSSSSLESSYSPPISQPVVREEKLSNGGKGITYYKQKYTTAIVDF